jgi:hypothetical protein
MFNQKLTFLKTFRKLLANCLFDDARTREADQRTWLCNIQVGSVKTLM